MSAVIASKLCSHSLDRCQPAISLPTKNPQWEQSLLAIAVCQSALMLDVRRHRKQALLPQFGSVPACDFPANKNPQWEQSLLAIAACQSALMLDVRRHRKQALLPQFGSVPACDFPANKNPQ
ncbi:hypothetical protein BK657_08030 [Pseudomonas brassicacearum]|nr:hypothetical protein BK657_08030 [Pseudomonas brassicacearum]